MPIRSFLAAAGLFLLAGPAGARTIGPGITGTWYNPAQDGHGFSVEYLNETTTVIYWYVYTPEGEPTFLVTAATNDGMSTSGTATIQQGMRFSEFDPDDLVREPWGTVTLTWNDCGSATLSYEAIDAAYGEGTIELSKFLDVEGVKCSDALLHGNYTMTMDDGSGAPAVGAAMAFANGELVWAASNAEAAETGLGEWIAGEGGAFTFSGTSFEIYEEGTSPVTGTGTVGYNGFRANGNNLVMSGTPSPAFQLGRRTSDLAGTYDLLDLSFNEVIGSISVLANGSVSGVVSENCDVDGRISSPDSKYNQYRVQLQISGCIDRVPLVGGAFWDPDNDTYFMIANDGFFGYVLEMLRTGQ